MTLLHYKGYIGKAEVDPEAGIIHGEVLGIRDTITFQADTARELTKTFIDSVNDYLAFCAERGEKPEKPASGKFVVRVSEDLHRKLAIIAKCKDTSLNALVSDYLEREVKEELLSDIIVSQAELQNKKPAKKTARAPERRRGVLA
jgi:predicted HicB family RNase H-like nuclease